MKGVYWKFLLVFLLLCVFVHELASRWSHGRLRRKLPGIRLPASTKSGAAAKASSAWEWDWARDMNDYGLSEQQCESAFPDLTFEIDRAVDVWRDRDITSETIELFDGNEAGVRVLIHDREIRIIETKGNKREDFHQRIDGILHQIERAINSVDSRERTFPDMEFTIVVDDYPNLPASGNRTMWSFARDLTDRGHEDVWLIPSFTFWSAGESGGAFEAMQTMARDHDSLIGEKKPQVIWRGVEWTAPELRGALLNVTYNQSWADVEAVRWDWTEDENAQRKKLLKQDDYCDYQFIVNTEGRSWSSRLTHLLNCDCVPVVHGLQWTTHYYHLLQPNVHFVPVSRDFSDLEAQVQHHLHDTTAAQRIANNARETFRERYTTPAAIACYWRKLLRSWRTVSFEPTIFEGVPNTINRRARGIELAMFRERFSNIDFLGGSYG